MLKWASSDEGIFVAKRSPVAKRLAKIDPYSVREVFSDVRRVPSVINLGIG
jgi:hypothetical protein